MRMMDAVRVVDRLVITLKRQDVLRRERTVFVEQLDAI